MAKDTVTIALSGTPRLSDLAVAIFNFSALIAELAKKRGASGIEWVVSGLEYGSAVATAQGIARIPEDSWYVERVVEDYRAVGQAAKSGRIWQLYEPKVAKCAAKIAGVINGHVRSVRFETPDEDIEVFAPIDEKRETRGTIQPTAMVPEYSLGTVVGRLQTVSNRGGLRFTLYEIASDHAVSCYLPAGADSEATLRDLWGKVVAVDGTVRRSPLDDAATTIREITGIQRHPVNDSASYDFREVRGILKLRRSQELPEAVIRSIRQRWAEGRT